MEFYFVRLGSMKLFIQSAPKEAVGEFLLDALTVGIYEQFNSKQNKQIQRMNSLLFLIDELTSLETSISKTKTKIYLRNIQPSGHLST